MNKTKLKQLLAEFDRQLVDNYVEYCQKLNDEKDTKTGAVKNAWFTNLSDETLEKYYRKNFKTGLEFDGRHVTITKTGITYDYQAYKSKMLMVYPESIIDVQLVKESDEFTFEKESGSVKYTHKIGNPFGDEKTVGGYCVIKNKRGEFLTLLSEKDFDKHKKVAKTDMIWNAWPDEMKKKTLIKKGCNNFKDDFKEIEENDNDNYDLTQLENELDKETQEKIDGFQSVAECETFYKTEGAKYIDVKEALIKALAFRKKTILAGF
ncbi:MAG TPA: recombinase RecT [Spirochaetota bacterium]|nr:recombinase RecT [Spirochaetota bacterium]